MKCFLNIMNYKTKEFIDTLTPMNKLWEVLLQGEPLGSCKEKAPNKLSKLKYWIKQGCHSAFSCLYFSKG